MCSSGEQLVLGYFAHKGLRIHHAATAHQHFVILVLLYDLLKILQDQDAQEVLKHMLIHCHYVWAPIYVLH